MQIMFEEGIIGTIQLTDSVVLPEYMEFLGKHIDLAPLKSLLTSVHDTASSMAKNISSHAQFNFPIKNGGKEKWLLTTYLDSELRISRDDDGNVYVLMKAGKSPLTPY